MLMKFTPKSTARRSTRTASSGSLGSPHRQNDRSSVLTVFDRRAMEEPDMSNHFTGLSLGLSLGDQRLDLCDLYAFRAPGAPSGTVLILNANPNADAMHPDVVA